MDKLGFKNHEERDFFSIISDFNTMFCFYTYIVYTKRLDNVKFFSEVPKPNGEKIFIEERTPGTG
jgi:hypothetical protein